MVDPINKHIFLIEQTESNNWQLLPISKMNYFRGMNDGLR